MLWKNNVRTGYLQEQIDGISRKLAEALDRIDNNEQKIKQLRGLVNRKLGYEDESTPTTERKNLNNTVLLPE